MADEIEGMDDEDQPSAKKKSPVKLILIVLVVLVLAGGGFVGWTMMQPDDDSAPAPSGGGSAGKQAAKGPVEPDVGQMFELDPFVVNLSDPGGKRYLKSKIELEFLDESVRKELTARLPQLRDVILLFLSSKSMEEIQSVEGKIELRNSLISRINQALKIGKIKTLYFTQFVIQ